MRRTDPAGASGRIAAEDSIRSFTIWPHRSLTRSGQRQLLVVVAIGALLSVLRLPAGAAIPVAVGAFTTIGAMALALWSNNRAARCGEIVEVGREVVHVLRVGPRGPEERMQFATGWVRVNVTHDRQSAYRLTLTESGRACQIGECLSPRERQALGEAIAASVDAARSALHRV